MDRAFTIVELLIVIVVIAILAAISITAYNGIQDRASDSGVSSDLANFMKRAEVFAIDNGRYPINDAELSSLSLKATKNLYIQYPTVSHNLIPCYDSPSGAFAVAAISKSGKRLFSINGRGVQEYTGTTSWIGSNRQTSVCTSIMPNSNFIANGVGYYFNGTDSQWRTWIDG